MATLPATFIAISVPEAFIRVLGFAGMILTVIALLLPAFLFLKIDRPKHIKCLEHRSITYALVVFAMIIIACEIVSLMKN
jgi:tyrosine-specific transport protein